MCPATKQETKAILIRKRYIKSIGTRASVSREREPTCEEPVRENVSGPYEGEVQPDEAQLSPPTAAPLPPPLLPWDDEADSDW